MLSHTLNAYGMALEHLLVYFVAAALIAFGIAFVVAAAGSIQSDPSECEVPAGLQARLRRHLFEVCLYCFAFTLFGTITAYFLAQGLTDEGAQISNPLIASFVTPFIALLTGGVAFVASKTRLMVSRNDVVLGVICFLISCVLSYEAMKQAEFASDEQAATQQNVTSNLVDGPLIFPAAPPDPSTSAEANSQAGVPAR